MKALFAVAILALSTGCASLGSMPGEESGPLRAYLLPHQSSMGGISFHVSRPAHVAVFRIVPGQGTAMVYPTSGISSRNNLTYSGFRSLSLGFEQRYDDYMFTGFGTHDNRGPEFYFLIASEEPLRLEQFGDFGSGLNTAIGTSFSFGSGQLAMERLVSLAVPNIADESWTTDYYVHWPENDSRRRNMVQISCNGTVINVPAESAAWAAQQLCARTQVNPGAPSDSVTTPPVETPQDSVVEPRRRAPVQPADRISSIQLTNPDAWEQLREVAERAAVTGDPRTRSALRATDFEASDAGLQGTVNRSRPTQPSSGSSTSGTDNVESPRSRPAPESAARPSAPSASERERPTPSDGGSIAQPLAPRQPD